MFIVRYPLQKQSIHKFAEQYGLEMEVRERDRDEWPDKRFKAKFTDTICNCTDIWGFGPTEVAAIQDYIRKIENKLLQIHPCQGNKRINVKVPEFDKYEGE